MSLRTLQGIRIRGLNGGTVSGGSDSGGWVSIRDLQAALTVYAYEAGQDGRRLPGPGALDGRWGSRTEASLEAAMVDGGLSATDNVEISDDRTQIKRSSAIVDFIATYAPGYQARMTQETAPAPNAGGRPTTGSGVVIADPQDDVPDGGLAIDEPGEYLYQPTVGSVLSKIPWWGWVLIGLSAAGASYGIYRWWIKNKRR